MLTVLFALLLAGCGGSSEPSSPSPTVLPAGPTKALALGPMSVQIPEDWQVQAQVARVPGTSARCTVQRLPPNAARDYAKVQASAERLAKSPPEGVEASWEESPVGERPGVLVTMTNTKMKGDWRSVQRMVVVEEACVAAVQCSGSPFPQFESVFNAVLASVSVDPAGCATP